MTVGPEVLATVAAIIAGFGVAMLFFRIERELEMSQRGERIWIPWADWLLVAATVCAALVVLLPLLLVPESKLIGRRVPAAGCSAVLVGLVGYVFGILAHYRLLLGSGRHGPRTNPEPAERLVVIGTVVGSLVVFAGSLLSTE